MSTPVQGAQFASNEAQYFRKSVRLDSQVVPTRGSGAWFSAPNTAAPWRVPIAGVKMGHFVKGHCADAKHARSIDVNNQIPILIHQCCSLASLKIYASEAVEILFWQSISLRVDCAVELVQLGVQFEGKFQGRCLQTFSVETWRTCRGSLTNPASLPCLRFAVIDDWCSEVGIPSWYQVFTPEHNSSTDLRAS